MKRSLVVFVLLFGAVSCTGTSQNTGANSVEASTAEEPDSAEKGNEKKEEASAAPDTDTSTQDESPEVEETPEETSDPEAESRQWILDRTIESIEPLFEESGITSISAKEWTETCYLESAILSPRWGDSDFWQISKAYIRNAQLFASPIATRDFDRFLFECSADVMTPQEIEELVRSGFLTGETEIEQAPAPTPTPAQAPTPTSAQAPTPTPAQASTSTPAPAPTPTSAPAPTPTPEPEPTGTVSQQQAVESAQGYLNYSYFSRSGLIDQLEYEGFSTADATYGVDAQNADWNAQAAGSAQDYLNYSYFSRSGLIDQLVYEGFTLEQATYGVNAVGL